MPSNNSSTRVNSSAQSLARGLGWFSIGLGVTELLAPGSIKRATGMVGPRAVLRAYGLREIATGIAILTSAQPVKLVWARVAGDMLDLATAAPVLRANNPQRDAGEASFAFLLMATALDIMVAMQGDEKPAPAPRPPLRSGVRLNTRPADLPEGVAPANRYRDPAAIDTAPASNFS